MNLHVWQFDSDAEKIILQFRCAPAFSHSVDPVRTFQTGSAHASVPVVKPRITINTNKDGELEIWLNEAGRDLLVRELQGLSVESDHFHLQPEGFHEVPVQGRAYREGDQILEWGKVLFRPDEWDRQHFPHVLAPDEASDGEPNAASRPE